VNRPDDELERHAKQPFDRLHPMSIADHPKVLNRLPDA